MYSTLLSAWKQIDGMWSDNWITFPFWHLPSAIFSELILINFAVIIKCSQGALKEHEIRISIRAHVSSVTTQCPFCSVTAVTWVSRHIRVYKGHVTRTVLTFTLCDQTIYECFRWSFLKDIKRYLNKAVFCNSYCFFFREEVLQELFLYSCF